MILRLVENPLAEAMLAGTYQPGDTVVVSAAGDGTLKVGRKGGNGASVQRPEARPDGRVKTPPLGAQITSPLARSACGANLPGPQRTGP